MTRPHDRQREDNKGDAPEPELTAEVIKDLDPPKDVIDEIRGGFVPHNSTNPNCNSS